MTPRTSLASKKCGEDGERGEQFFSFSFSLGLANGPYPRPEVFVRRETFGVQVQTQLWIMIKKKQAKDMETAAKRIKMEREGVWENLDESGR